MAAQPNPDTTPIWRKSRASGGNAECIEVATCGASVLVRDSSAQSGAILQLSPEQWRGFVSRVKDAKAELG
jgi:hypothetical protein